MIDNGVSRFLNVDTPCQLYSVSVKLFATIAERVGRVTELAALCNYVKKRRAGVARREPQGTVRVSVTAARVSRATPTVDCACTQ